MPTFKEIQKRLQTFSLDQQTAEIVNANPAEITKLNKKQLAQGFSSDGQTLGNYRSDEYAAYKNYLNPRAGYGNVDLYLTGDFQRSFKAAVEGRQLKVWATDSKAAKLGKKYGEDRIYGLDGQSVDQYRAETLKPELSARFRQKVLQ